MRPLLVAALALFAGTTLLLSELRWFRRPRLAERLLPYAPTTARAGLPTLSLATIGEVVRPLAQAFGARLAAGFGVSEDLETRLHRVHSPLTPTAFRVRQFLHSGLALGVAAAVGAVVAAPTPVVIVLVAGAPLLAFLVHEQRVASASQRWQRRVFLELPVVAEQLAMLAAAGWSLGASVERIAERGRGATASDFARVVRRTTQGVDVVRALREWAELVGVDAADRLVSVLALDRDATDLGTLISEEARALRADAQRELVESIETRNQQVWIPVTVAALVPGVLLMGVPFLDALALFSAS